MESLPFEKYCFRFHYTSIEIKFTTCIISLEKSDFILVEFLRRGGGEWMTFSNSVSRQEQSQ